MTEGKQTDARQARGTGTRNTQRETAGDAPEQGAAGEGYTGPQSTNPLDENKQSVPQSISTNDPETWDDPNGLYHTGTTADVENSTAEQADVGMKVHERISEHLGIPVEERGPLWGVDPTPSNQR